ncbi:MAG: hypothetical protein LBU90_10320 [Bacteroidales bacterium]|jgi:hypothetical protein|nr:hypothetical protein [Bacteroidales bacterium]
MEKLIYADKKLREQVRKAFACTDATIGNSLLFKHNSQNNIRIRTYAVRNGASFLRKTDYTTEDLIN